MTDTVDGALKLELQVLQDMELGRHMLTEDDLIEIEVHMSLELNREYRIPEAERETLLVRNKTTSCYLKRNYGLQPCTF